MPKAKARYRSNRPRTRPHVLSVCGSTKWRAWLAGLASFKQLKAADLVDAALVEYAQRHGYPDQAPPR